jgi:hypothetical protein
VRVFGAGGYVYPEDDVARLSEEVHRFAELGFTHVKIKIGSVGPSQDRKRIEAAAKQLPAAPRTSPWMQFMHTTPRPLRRRRPCSPLSACGGSRIFATRWT